MSDSTGLLTRSILFLIATGLCSMLAFSTTLISSAASLSGGVMIISTDTIYTITPTAGPNGTIQPDSAVSVPKGGTQKFAVTPAPGFKISDVFVDSVSVGLWTVYYEGFNGSILNYTFDTVNANHTISATFTDDKVTIQASAGEHGSISPSGNVVVPGHGEQEFKIEPDQGYQTSEVIVDGQSMSPTESYTFTNVSANHNISAVFEKRK